MEWSREERYQKLEDINKEKYNKLIEKVKNSKYRQKFHIQPKTGLLNDPNGFSYFDGKYHLFYQWFPLGPVHGVKYWYHVSSEDLVFWEDEGIGMKPDTIYDSHGVFSGSAIEKDDKLYLFYTGNTRDKNWNRNPYQCIAIMNKKGEITKEKIPFVMSPPEGYTDNFRDPKVLKKNGMYYCVIGAEDKDNKGKIVYYESKDLHNWNFKGDIKTKFTNENTGFMWECPDYFEIGNKGILMFSPQGIKPEGDLYNNVFQSGYLIGDPINFETGEFLYKNFVELDRGFDFYAPQTMEDSEGRRILIGWFGLPEINCVTDIDGWAHCLTLPRILEVVDNRLIQNPIPELKKLRKESYKIEEEIDGEFLIDNKFRTYELKILFENIKNKEVGIKFRVGEKEECVFYYSSNEKKLVLDRTKTEQLEAKEYGTVRKCAFEEENLKLHVFLDESSIEIFVNDGIEVFSSRLFNNKESNKILLFSSEKIKVETEVWKI